MYLRIICTKAEHLLYESCYSDEPTAIRVSDTGPCVHVEKLALMALYTRGRSVLACKICITRTTVKLIASISFSDTRRKKAFAVLAGRYFIRSKKGRIYHCMETCMFPRYHFLGNILSILPVL